MRTMLYCSILSLALAAGGCKKSQDDTGKAASDLKKTQENVDDQRKDLDKTEANKDSTAKDLNKAEGDLAAAKADFTAARDKYAITVKDRLAKLDIKLQELASSTDAKAKATADQMRVRRDELAKKIDAMKDRAATDWQAFTKDVDNTFDGIEKDLR